MTAGNSNNTEEKTELLGNGSKPPLDDIPFDKPKRSWNKILGNIVILRKKQLRMRQYLMNIDLFVYKFQRCREL